jgi:hypothetical protein
LISYDQLGIAFQARHLAVPMESAYCVDPATSVQDALEELRLRHFDQAPVRRGQRITGYVLESRLATAPPASRVSQYAQTIREGNLVSADAPIGKLLEWIIAPGLLFVIDGREITGFVTVSDFNRQAARAYFYLLIATLEAGLAELVRSRFIENQEQCLALLWPEQAADVRRKFATDVRDDTQADLVANMNFSHLLRVALRDQDLRGRLGAVADVLERDFNDVVRTRNQIMHPTGSLVTRKAGAVRLRAHEELLRATVQRIELVHEVETAGITQ